ncbi:MAG: septum formation initiator family protein [Candidatus Paceibacterota bacterium]
MVAKKLKKRKPRNKQALFTKIFWVASCSFLFVYLAFANVKIFIQRHENSGSLKQLEVNVSSLKSSQEKLSLELGATATPEYLERVAREEFGYKKEGEQVVVVKKEESKQAQAGQASGLQFIQNIINWISEKLNKSATPE